MKHLFKRVQNKVEREAIDFFARIGLGNIMLKQKKGAAILCYHGVDAFGSKELNMRFFSKISFEKHLQLLHNNFHIISVDDFFNSRFKKDRFNVALTFDDGYKNNYKYVFPLLQKYNAPASFYVTGINNTKYDFLWADFVEIVSKYGNKNEITVDSIQFIRSNSVFRNIEGQTLHTFIKEKGNWDIKTLIFSLFPEFYDISKKYNLEDYWQLMSDKEIREMSNCELVTIGSHGYYHNNLGNLQVDEALKEVKLSIEYLQRITGKTISEIAFPDGSYSQDINSELNKIGISKQLALDYLYNEDAEKPYIINRNGMYPVFSEFSHIYSIQNCNKWNIQ